MKLMKDDGIQTPSRRVSTSAGEQVSQVPTLFAGSAKRMGHGSLVRMGMRIAVGLLAIWLAAMAWSQGVTTTTVQGTVYLANGQPGAGTLVISWPGFTTAAGQAVAADSLTVTIAPDGFVSVNLAPNQGATPAGEYYTAVYYMSDGTVNTQYWVIPAAAQATLAQVQVQIMPATEAVQAVSKAYVDEAITELSESLLTASGGTLSGPLYLNADPTQPMQASTKHYVDAQVATSVPLAGGNMTGALTTPAVNGVEAPTAASGQTTLQAAMNAAGINGAMEIPPTYAGTDRFTNANGVKVVDWRTSGSQQTERSVKEFGAVCDGVTDDTSALQAALSYANAHGVALLLPEGTCKTRALSWRGESIGGLGKQISSLMGFPGEDVLVSGPDALNILSSTRLTDEERALRQRQGLTLRQIAYRRRIRADFRGLTAQEYAEDEESCFLASGESVFELAAVEARLKSAPEPVERRKNGELEVWLPPVKGKEYVVAVDPAGGGSNGDYSAAEVLEMETGLQCAEFAGHVGGLELARFVAGLAAEYNGAWLVVERNNHGSGVLALAETACKYERIYQQGGQAGWLTTSMSRPGAISRLSAALVEEPACFQSRRLLGECRSFVRQPNGSSGAQAGTHDDCVMAMAIGLAARAELAGKRRSS
ncbi:MAG: glycosyl hydrolase family 28-related protein [Terracidiphilus sp.]